MAATRFNAAPDKTSSKKSHGQHVGQDYVSAHTIRAEWTGITDLFLSS